MCEDISAASALRDLPRALMKMSAWAGFFIVAKETKTIFARSFWVGESVVDGSQQLGVSTHFCPPHKLVCKWLRPLLETVKNESERAGAVSQVEQFLKEQQAVRPLVRLGRWRHGEIKIRGKDLKSDGVLCGDRRRKG
jgi:hypothetical protein